MAVEFIEIEYIRKQTKLHSTDMTPILVHQSLSPCRGQGLLGKWGGGWDGRDLPHPSHEARVRRPHVPLPPLAGDQALRAGGEPVAGLPVPPGHTQLPPPCCQPLGKVTHQ